MGALHMGGTTRACPTKVLAETSPALTPDGVVIVLNGRLGFLYEALSFVGSQPHVYGDEPRIVAVGLTTLPPQEVTQSLAGYRGNGTAEEHLWYILDCINASRLGHALHLLVEPDLGNYWSAEFRRQADNRKASHYRAQVRELIAHSV